jgi:hypothetical protein
MTPKQHEYRIRISDEAQQSLLERQRMAEKITGVKIGLPTLLVGLIEKVLKEGEA